MNTEHYMLRNVKGGKLQDLVKQQIRAHIIDSGLKSGDHLPTESKLAEQLGISKTTVREALKALENVGILESRHGVGNFIKEFSYDVILENLPYSLETDVHSLQEIVEIRACLERHFIVRDMGKFNDQDIEDLWSIYRELEKTNSPNSVKDAIEAHSAFHCALYRHSGNRLLIKLIRLFSTLQRNLVLINRYWTTDPDSFLLQHGAIIEAIKKKDSEMATRVMGYHFADVLDWLSQEKAKTCIR
ncbi:MAG: FadR/GntR family transcriptional regulator [Spirochaetes bacterium]|nr:FadR/GntR family transcriptional regulator [Spirochaetota bacterium]